MNNSIEEMLFKGERVTLECKKAQRNVPNSLWETYSAFANTYGGTILIGYGENLGSGFPLILNAWNEKHWMKPELLEQQDLMQVKLTLYIQNEPINEPINELLTERQQAIIAVIQQNPTLNREELANKTGLSVATLKREITILREKGYIERKGSNKSGQWLIQKMIQQHS